MTKTNAGSPKGRESYGDGVPIVVAGVTTCQGRRESRLQGEGEQVTGHQERKGMRNAERRDWIAPASLEALSCRMRLTYHSFLLRVVAFLIFFRGNVLAGGVQALGVIPVNPFQGREHDVIGPAPRPFSLDELFLVEAVQRLGRRIIIRISLAPDRPDRADLAEPLGIADRGILNSAIRMMDQLAVHPVATRPDSHFKRVERQLSPERIGNLPADNHPGKQVKDERCINKANGSLYVSNVSYPAAVRRRRGEVAFQQVRRPLLAGRARHSGPRPLLPGPQARQAHLAHQPLDPAPRDLDPVTIQLAPHLLSTVKPPPSPFPCPHDCHLQHLITLVPRRRTLLSPLRRVISGRRYLQDRAGRLHSEPVLMQTDELD